jgi:acetyltransferase
MNSDLNVLRPFFDPESVALIGATRKLGFGYGQTRALLSQGFGERLYYVNPSETELYGRPVYPNIGAIPSPVELAILMVPARLCPQVMAECADKGVRNAIVLAAGFSEIGEEGARIESEMAGIARHAGLRVVGPNCIGVVNTRRGFATAEMMREAFEPGHVGVIAQSGVFGNILLDWAPEQGVRFSKVITIGNRCDVGEAELVRYLAEDEETRVIAMYLEGFQDARSSMAAFQEASRRKPILVLKSGRTPPGRAATLSHTGSLSGDDALCSGLFRQSGVLRFNDLYELFDVAKAFASQPTPSGKRVAIVTTSGSLGALTADVCWNLGLEIASLSPETVQGIKAMAPPWMNVRNPLDLGPSGLLVEAVRRVAEDPGVDGVIAIFVIPYMVIQEIRKLGLAADRYLSPIRDMGGSLRAQKPILFSTLGNAAFRAILTEALPGGIPLMSTPENAAKAFWALRTYGSWRQSAPMT